MSEFHEINLQDIEEALLEVDGSCRDVNFESPTWDGVSELIRYLEQSFEERSACDDDGNPLKEPHSEIVVSSARRRKSAYLYYESGTAIVTELQVFIYCEDNDSPFVELSFFPQDVMRSEDLGRKFIAWIKEMRLHLRAHRSYCRYENVSWRFGDTACGSGVFFISGPEALDA